MDVLIYNLTIYNLSIQKIDLENEYENQVYSIMPIVGIGRLPTRQGDGNGMGESIQRGNRATL